MAIMTDPDRAAAWAEFMQELSQEREAINLSKPDLRAALDAVDQWVSDNAASLNSAIPQPARANLTSSQKARLLMHVVRKRFVRGV